MVDKNENRTRDARGKPKRFAPLWCAITIRGYTTTAVRRPPHARRPLPRTSRAHQPHCRTRWHPRRRLARACGDRKRPVWPVHALMARTRPCRWCTMAAARRHRHLRERDEQCWVSRGRCAAWGWGWRGGNCGAKQRPLQPVQCECGATRALRAHLGRRALAANGEVGGGADRGGGEANEVGRHVGAVRGGLVPLRGSCEARRVLLVRVGRVGIGR